jgi:hypothetical protein
VHGQLSDSGHSHQQHIETRSECGRPRVVESQKQDKKLVYVYLIEETLEVVVHQVGVVWGKMHHEDDEDDDDDVLIPNAGTATAFLLFHPNRFGYCCCFYPHY